MGSPAVHRTPHIRRSAMEDLGMGHLLGAGAVMARKQILAQTVEWFGLLAEWADAGRDGSER
jgi:hypothetical protein